jgi:hypothetical protein
MSFQPLTSLVSLLKRVGKFVYVTERSRQKHDKNVWEWSDFLGVGMDFQVKEWNFLLRNGLHACRVFHTIVIPKEGEK